MTDAGVKCLFCGQCFAEKLVANHLERFHNIKSLFLAQNFKDVATQIDPEDRNLIYSKNSDEEIVLHDEPENSELPHIQETQKNIGIQTQTIVEPTPDPENDQELQPVKLSTPNTNTSSENTEITKNSKIPVTPLNHESISTIIVESDTTRQPNVPPTLSDVGTIDSKAPNENQTQERNPPQTSVDEAGVDDDGGGGDNVKACLLNDSEDDLIFHRFRCPECSFVSRLSSIVDVHIKSEHSQKKSKLSRKRKSVGSGSPIKQSMSVFIDTLKIPFENPPQNQSEGPDNKKAKFQISSKKFYKNNASSSRKSKRINVEAESTRRTRSCVNNRNATPLVNTRTARNKNLSRRTKSGQVGQTKSKSTSKTSKLVVSQEQRPISDQGKPQEFNVEQSKEECIEKENCDVSVDNLSIRLDTSSIRYDDEVTTLQELDDSTVSNDIECVILEEVINSKTPLHLSPDEEKELQQILETCNRDKSEDVTILNESNMMLLPDHLVASPSPGPSRPYQCPQCPEKFDTEPEANVHLVTCPGMNVTHVSSDTDDTSSLVTSLNTNTRSWVESNVSMDRSIKTSNINKIKSNVFNGNVYVRFVQTYYSSYRRRFPALSSRNLIQKLREGYKLLRSSNHPSIQKLQEEYDKDRMDIFNNKIRTIVKSLEEDGCAEF